MSLAFVRICAVLIGVRSLTNFAKLLQGDEAILVVFGQILRGSDAAIPAALVGVFMLVTAIAMWQGGRWAFPMIAAYATYVIVNMVVWTVTNPGEFERVGAIVSSATDPGELRRNGALAFLGYVVVAIGTTAVPAWILWKRRAAAAA